MTLSAGDVREMRFTRTSFREGYDPAEVDAFLERVATTLAGYASGRPPEAPLTPEHVAAVLFRPTRFREGYDQDEVDDFLDLVADALAQASVELHEPGAPVGHGPPGTPGTRAVLDAHAAGTGPHAAGHALDAATLRASVPAPARRGPGYVVEEVDAFVERAARALEERRRGGVPELTPHEVRTVRFRAAGWRGERYPYAEVDALLDRVEAALAG